MPITVSQLAANTAKVTFSFGGYEINIDYYPSRVTEQTIAVFDQFNTNNIAEGFKNFNDTLATLIKSWDVLEDDGVTMYPLEPDRLAALPIALRMQVLNAIMGDIRPEALMGTTTTPN